MATPDPTEVAPWYLRNINQALELNEATGQVFVRTDAQLTIGNVGNINVNEVEIVAMGNIDISGNTMPVSGNVTVFQGTNPWVVTGNANVAITSGNVGITGNIAGITANVTVVDGGGSITVDGTVNATITGGNVATTIGGTNLDAFGRLRVSNPVTLFDTQNMYVDSGQFSNITANGGTVTYVANESSFNLAVTAANGSSVVSQCKTTQPYLPGKSLLCLESFAFATLAAGCRQRVGYFTTNNGIYFEADGEDLYLVIRSKASGAVQEERIAQANWNTNTLKTGVSPNPLGINLNPALTNIFWCDIEWLGVGNVRAGFIINGEFIVCHTFQHANQAGNTTVYMTSATLNPRYEITNTANTAGARTMKQICSTVISEGGYLPTPTIGFVDSGIRPTRVATANVYTNLATIRLNPDCIDAVVTPSQIDLLLTSVSYGSWQLVVGASNVAGLTYANVGLGIIQANTSAVQIGDGTVVYGGVTSSRDTSTIGEDVARRIQLSRHANGTPITLTLCAGYGSNNADVIWRFGWGEVTS
jgi:hypothetical protein